MCLQARDYKGFGTGTQLQNGVLVYTGNIPNDTRGGVLVVFKSDRYPHHTVNAVPCTTQEE